MRFLEHGCPDHDGHDADDTDALEDDLCGWVRAVEVCAG